MVSDKNDQEYSSAYFKTLYGIGAVLRKYCEDLKAVESKNISVFSRAFLNFAAGRLSISNSQLMQDIFALFILDGKRDGVFVEFGAVDGIYLSNTYLLETSFGWKGLLVEPARTFHVALANNRRCAVDYRCVWRESGQKFAFVDTDVIGLGTLAVYRNDDEHAEIRQNGGVYDVDTVSLNDVLNDHSMAEIDFLSIDTEGSEAEIIESFNIEFYKPKIVMVEHNYIEPKRNAILQKMLKNDYIRVLEDSTLQEDWFVERQLLDKFCVKKFGMDYVASSRPSDA